MVTMTGRNQWRTVKTSRIERGGQTAIYTQINLIGVENGEENEVDMICITSRYNRTCNAMHSNGLHATSKGGAQF
jgi:hypothetical protein